MVTSRRPKRGNSRRQTKRLGNQESVVRHVAPLRRRREEVKGVEQILKPKYSMSGTIDKLAGECALCYIVTAMLKDMLVKKMLKSKLKGMVSDEQIEQIMAMVDKNPKFFEEMLGKFQQKVSQGKSQEQAAREIFAEHGDEVKTLFQDQ